MDDFSQRYSELYDYVYRYLYLRVNDRELAQDLTSKTFLTAFEIKANYDSEKGTWIQWITGISKNCLLNHWRSHKTFLPLEEVILKEEDLALHHSSQNTLGQDFELKKIMDSVSPDIRALLMLRYVDDLTYEDIAEILNKTPAAVRKIFSRLHKQLKDRFSKN